MAAREPAGPEVPALALAVSAGLGASSLALGPVPALLGAAVSAAVALWLVARWRPVAATTPAEGTSRDRDALYQAVLDQLGHGVAAVDRTGAMLVYNPAAMQILGTVPELPLGRALAGETVDAEDMYVVHPKTGRPMWLRVTARPLALEGQAGSVVVFRDVTARKQVEVALARSEARHRALMQAAPYGVAIFDLDGRLVEHNPALVALLGDPSDLHGSLAALDLLADGPTTDRITTVTRADGSGVDLQVLMVPIATQGAAPTLFAVTLYDLTARVRAERLKDAFMATVSHELRTPLTSIIGSLKLLTGGAMGPLPAKVDKMVHIAEGNSVRLLALVNDLLDLQRLAAGELELDLHPLDLAQVVDQAAEANRGYAQQMEVRLEIELPAEPVWIEGDRERLLQVFANLMSNAAKFSPPGEAVVVRVHATPPSATVTDVGPGIPEDLQDRVFDRFAHGATPSNPNASTGTGLGLAISRAITSRHGGTLTFETAAERGTTFSLTLPALATTGPPPAAASGPPPRS